MLAVAACLWLTGSALVPCLLQPATTGERLGAWLWSVAAVLVLGVALLARGLLRLAGSWRRGLWTSCSAVPFRAWLYMVFVAWATSLLLAERYDAILLRLLLGLGAATFGLGLELSFRIGPRLPRLVRAVDLVLFNLVLLVAVGELGLRALAAARPTPLLCFDSVRSGRRLASHQLAPGVLRFGFPFNSLGHYDSEFVRSDPTRQTVLCLGDSFSVGVVPHHFHFTTVAERLLPGVELFNMGVPAADPPEYLHLLLTQGLALEPDRVVVNVFVGNDFVFQLERQQDTGPLARWLSRKSLLLYQVPRRVAALAGERRRLRPLVGRAHCGPARRVTSVEELFELFPWLQDPSLEEPTLSDEKLMEIELARALFHARLPEAQFESAFEVLADIRRAAGSLPVLVMIIPDQFQVDDDLWQRVQTAAGHPLPRDRCQQLLVRWLEGHGIPHLDLLPILRAVPPLADGNRHLYHRADTHFNVRGNQVAGVALAEFLASP